MEAYNFLRKKYFVPPDKSLNEFSTPTFADWDGLVKLLEEYSCQIEPQVIKPNGGFVIEGELIEKNVTHDETILKLEDSGENAILILPRDLDDFVKVGSILKITIEEC
jgi:hypothetical protein